MEWFVDKFTPNAAFRQQTHRTAGMDPRRIMLHLIGKRRQNAELGRVWTITSGLFSAVTANVLRGHGVQEGPPHLSEALQRVHSTSIQEGDKYAKEESGVNGILPLEVSAEMDVVSLREKYGKNLRMIGNIDKKALLAGPEAIGKEVESKVRKLVREGGYIPGIDHEVPEDVSFSNYCFYVNLLKRTCSEL